MRKPPRKTPQRLLESLQERVEEVGDKLIGFTDSLSHTFEVDIDKLRPDMHQARRVFDDDGLNGLAASLKDQGQLQPILVRPMEGVRNCWIIVAGERRWRAAKIAGIQRLIAIERSKDYELASLTENLQRSDLHPIEEAIAIGRVAESYQISQRELAKRLGRSASDINGMLAIAKMPEDVQATVLNSEHPIARNLLIEMARLPDIAQLRELVGEATKGRVTIATIRQLGSSRSVADKQDRSVAARATKGPISALPNTNRFVAKLAHVRLCDLSENDRASLERLRDQLNTILNEC